MLDIVPKKLDFLVDCTLRSKTGKQSRDRNRPVGEFASKIRLDDLPSIQADCGGR